MADDFSDSALVLVAHGSTQNADSAKPAHQHTDELRSRRVFAEVRAGFLKQQPEVSGVLQGIEAKRIFIVPLFISEGYYTEELLPRELGFRTNDDRRFARVRQDGKQALHYCGPVGTHPSMTGALLARAGAVVEQHPFPRRPSERETTLFIAGHGTVKNENSRNTVERQAALIRAKRGYADVRAVFLEEEPRVESCYELAGTQNIVVVPFFISDGLHSREDIPVKLGEPEKRVQQRLASGQPTWVNPTERRGKRVWYSASIGTEPFLAEVILERVIEAAAG
jgi:sirohydrochlorin cobaltochelatase